MDSDDEDHVYASAPSIHESTLGRAAPATLTIGDTKAPAAAPAAATSTWRDGRAVPPGFVAAAATLADSKTWAPPTVPKDWTPDPRRVWAQQTARAAAAPATAADRAAMLGEAKHPGPPPAISQYLDAKAAARAAASGHAPPTAPSGPVRVQMVSPDTAQRALQHLRKTGADAAKEARYIAYLQAAAQSLTYEPPAGADSQAEVDEFFEAASRYRPVHGDMAARFTSSTMLQDTPMQGGLQNPATFRPPPQEERAPELVSPAQQAARQGEFGALTRTAAPLYPARLLLRRLGIPDPHPDRDAEAPADDDDPASAWALGDRVPTAAAAPTSATDTPGIVFLPVSDVQESAMEEELQSKRPPMDLFKAVFASDDEDDDAPPATTPATLASSAVKRKAPGASKKKKRERVGPLTFDLDADDEPAPRAPPRRPRAEDRGQASRP